MEQDRVPLLEAVTEFIDRRPAYFRVPGHRLEKGISPCWTDKVGEKIFSYDVTETPSPTICTVLREQLMRPRNCLLRSMERTRVFFL